jgi:deoxyuridine 5'-triphosphate nucleotidohydrolase
MFPTNYDAQVDFIKIRDVKSPNRANPSDAGTDFYVPNYTPEFVSDLIKKNANRDLRYEIKDESDGTKLYVTIMPHEQLLIPSGIKVHIHDKDTYLLADNKSGIATNSKLFVGANTIDADYHGECHLHVINFSNEPTKVWTGMKIVQLKQELKYDTKWNEVSEEEYAELASKSVRGEGGFGSSTLK